MCGTVRGEGGGDGLPFCQVAVGWGDYCFDADVDADADADSDADVDAEADGMRCSMFWWQLSCWSKLWQQLWPQDGLSFRQVTVGWGHFDDNDIAYVGGGW